MQGKRLKWDEVPVGKKAWIVRNLGGDVITPWAMWLKYKDGKVESFFHHAGIEFQSLGYVDIYDRFAESVYHMEFVVQETVIIPECSV